MTSPKVAIVITLYNKEQYLAETIESVRSQSVEDWELIIVDDCSTDNSIEVVKPFLQHDARIRLYQNERNMGANYGRNLGIRKSTAPNIIFLDADDLLAPFCIERRTNILKIHPQLDFCVCPMNVFLKKPGDHQGKWIPDTKKPLDDFLSHKLPWQTMQPIWNKNFLKKLGGFDESFTRLQDVELHTRALLAPPKNFLIVKDHPDCYYRIDSGRVNYENFELLSRYVHSAVKYYNKFYLVVGEKKLQKKLLVTIYKIHSRILYGYKKKEINRKQLQILEKQLLPPPIISELNWFKRKFFDLAKLVSFIPFRVPGFNWIASYTMEL